MLGACYNRLTGPFRNQQAKLLEKEMLGCESLLDVGCGAQSPIEPFSKRLPRTVGVDGFEPSIRASRERGIHGEYRQMDILDIGDRIEPKSFDVVLASEVIEHLTKEEGWRLVEMMEKIARRKVIVFTPCGFLPQEAYDGNDFQVHKSGWTPAEMRQRGFRVYGVNGWKPLRGERAKIQWRPQRFWEAFSLLSQSVVTRRPEWAFHIFCVKDVA